MTTMKNEDNTMRELHQIRLKIYEQIKDMTPEEETAWYKMRTEPIMKEFGIKYAESFAADR